MYVYYMCTEGSITPVISRIGSYFGSSCHTGRIGTYYECQYNGGQNSLCWVLGKLVGHNVRVNQVRQGSCPVIPEVVIHCIAVSHNCYVSTVCRQEHSCQASRKSYRSARSEYNASTRIEKMHCIESTGFQFLSRHGDSTDKLTLHSK